MAARASNNQALHRFGRALAWALGGAIVFSLPTLMTMELWFLGFYLPGWKLAIFTVTAVVMFFGLSYYLGFEETYDIRTDILDTFIAYAIGFLTAALTLLALGILRSGMSEGELLGKIVVQAFPSGLGALLARNQLGGNRKHDTSREQARRSSTYFGQLFLMSVGAIFLSFNIAPTEEMVLIAHQLTPLRAAILAAVTLAMMHAFVWSSPLRSETALSQRGHGLQAFVVFTLVGYAIALLISAYMLWMFGRLDGLGATEALKSVIVLAFPAAIGAAASRMIL